MGSWIISGLSLAGPWTAWGSQQSSSGVDETSSDVRSDLNCVKIVCKWILSCSLPRSVTQSFRLRIHDGRHLNIGCLDQIILFCPRTTVSAEKIKRNKVNKSWPLASCNFWKRLICLVQDPDTVNLTCATMCCQLCFAGLLDEKVFPLRLSSLGGKSLFLRFATRLLMVSGTGFTTVTRRVAITRKENMKID